MPHPATQSHGITFQGSANNSVGPEDRLESSEPESDGEVPKGSDEPDLDLELETHTKPSIDE